MINSKSEVLISFHLGDGSIQKRRLLPQQRQHICSQDGFKGLKNFEKVKEGIAKKTWKKMPFFQRLREYVESEKTDLHAKSVFIEEVL